MCCNVRGDVVPSLQSHQRYLSLLLEAITGESEDLCRVRKRGREGPIRVVD